MRRRMARVGRAPASPALVLAAGMVSVRGRARLAGPPRAPLPVLVCAKLRVLTVARQGDDWPRAALELEQAARRAYLRVVSQSRTRDDLLWAAVVLVGEARHRTVWRRVLGQRLY